MRSSAGQRRHLTCKPGVCRGRAALAGFGTNTPDKRHMGRPTPAAGRVVAATPIHENTRVGRTPCLQLQEAETWAAVQRAGLGPVPSPRRSPPIHSKESRVSLGLEALLPSPQMMQAPAGAGTPEPLPFLPPFPFRPLPPWCTFPALAILAALGAFPTFCPAHRAPATATKATAAKMRRQAMAGTERPIETLLQLVAHTVRGPPSGQLAAPPYARRAAGVAACQCHVAASRRGLRGPCTAPCAFPAWCVA